MSDITGTRRIGGSVAGAVVLVLVLATIHIVGTSASASADTVTVAQDSLRTGWDNAEPALTQSQVASSSFGQLFSASVDGQVYAQPLVTNGLVIAATETNNVYALDGNSGALKWSRNVGAAWDPSVISCGDLAPRVGITSTPVYDPATGAVYLTAKTDDGGSPTTPNWYVHGLDVTTGAERPGFPVRIGGAPSNDPAHPFNAMTAAQRPGLLLLNGVVYAGFASYCDHGPFVGYVIGTSTSGKQTAMWSAESGNSSGEAGIWQSGAGLVSDGPGQILFATGNGISPQPAPGGTPPATLGESIVRLTVQPDGSLRPTDFFSPSNNAKLDQDDADLGSGGPLALPDGYGTTAHPHLLVHIGKDGKVYVLDRDSLGGMAQGPGGGDAILSTSGPYNGLWGRPAFLGTDNGGYLYYAGSGGPLRAFRIVPTATGGVTVASAGTSAGTFPYSSGSPVVTSNGRDGSSALIWLVYSTGGNGANAELRAYRALPDSAGLLQQVFSAPIGTAAKFSSLATSGGRVYVGTRDGRVYGFGAPTTAALGTASTDLGATPVGVAGSGAVTVTATRPVTLASISATAPFVVGSTALPLSLAKGASARLPLSFVPSAPGQVSGTLTVGTSDGEQVRLDVHGLGTRDGLGAAPAALQFTDVPTGSKSVQTVTIVNTGTSVVTLTGVTRPTSPELTLDASSLPAAGQQLQPQQSVAVAVTYTPTSVAGAVDSVTVTSTLGAVTVPINASAVSGAAHLTTPPSLAFGDVPLGLTSTLTFPISNSGNIAMTITKAKAPQGVFTTATPISEGLVIPAGASAYQTVTFAPTAAGPAGSADLFYLITTDDGTGPHQVMLTGNGVNDPIAALGARDGGSYSKPLGVVASGQYAAGDGRCQNFTNGYICSSPTAGLHEVRGAIAAAYRAGGGPTGSMGLPLTDEVAVGDSVGSYNDFSGANSPSVYWSPASGAHVILGGIKATWLSMGGARGQLGYPTTDELATADGVGRYNTFNGPAAPSIYWSPTSGAHYVWGAIKAEWVSRGSERGLGYPMTDEVCGLRDGGCAQHFSNSSSVYYSAVSGAHALTGAIRDKYASLGWQNGTLAYPTVDAAGPLPTGGGFAQHFQGGSIYYTGATGAHEVWGGIRVEWAATGWEGNLGYPTTDEFCGLRNGGCGQHFSNSASIYWSPASGGHLVRGMIRGQYAALGWETSQLGYPTVDEVCGLKEGGCAEHFQGGSIYYTPATGAHEVWGSMRAYWSAAGWQNSSLGYPTSNEYRVGVDIRQNFQRGYLLLDTRTGRMYRY